MDKPIDWKREGAAVIPCFNEARTIASVVSGVLPVLGAVFVVDDGSTDNTARLAGEAGAQVIQNQQNLGKGAALTRGLQEAHVRGFKWALLMDGDGQHSLKDIPALFQATATGPAMVVGNRMRDPSQMPLVRRWTNRIMSGLLSRMTGQSLPDTQCGFRLARLDALKHMELRASRFEIESEMLVAFLASGHRVAFVPVQTVYKDERSKIHPIGDTFRWCCWIYHSRKTLKLAWKHSRRVAA